MKITFREGLCDARNSITAMIVMIQSLKGCLALFYGFEQPGFESSVARCL